MADIFLSYANEDRARAEPLVDALQRYGFSVWWDRNIGPGRPYSRVIQEELDAAGAVVVVWSEASVESDWVEAEAARGKRRGVLVPVVIDDVTDRMPLEFSRLEAVELSDWDGAARHAELEHLFASVSELVRPTGFLEPADFVESIGGSDLAYLLLNAAGRETQICILPSDEDGSRQALVIDVAQDEKLARLVLALQETAVLPRLPDDGCLFPLVVGTHPHEDRIGGMPGFLRTWGNAIGEFWEPGLVHPSAAYHETINVLQDTVPRVRHFQPTRGTRRFVGRVKVLVVAPSVTLRERFDGGQVSVDDSSIVLKLELLSSRAEQSHGGRALLLGADATDSSWESALEDFGEIHTTADGDDTANEDASDDLVADVFKLPPHMSRHVLVPLVRAVRPGLTLAPSEEQRRLVREAFAEALRPGSASGLEDVPDHQLGLHHLSALDSKGPLGSIGLVLSPTGTPALWRFRDRSDEEIDLSRAWRLRGHEAERGRP